MNRATQHVTHPSRSIAGTSSHITRHHTPHITHNTTNCTRHTTHILQSAKNHIAVDCQVTAIKHFLLIEPTRRDSQQERESPWKILILPYIMFRPVAVLFAWSHCDRLLFFTLLLLSNNDNVASGFSVANNGRVSYAQTDRKVETGGPWLAKTTETFKLADLQFIEMKIQHEDCRRLVMDAKTGSMLLQFDGNPIDTKSKDIISTPAIQRCEWIAQVLAHGTTPTDLLQNIANKQDVLSTTTKSTLTLEEIIESNSNFSNALVEPSRLGKCHETLDSFLSSVPSQQTSNTNIREFSLVLITDPSNQNSRRILLGMKNRGFGKGLYTSFAGKKQQSTNKNEQESDAECASRELEEEAGIVIPPDTMIKHKVGTLHFTFEDDDNHEIMLMHVFHIEVTTTSSSSSSTTTSPSSLSIKIHPDNHELVDTHCDDEITPIWFHNWHDIPLDEMFADNSIWLTHILTNRNTSYFDGYFHYESGGQVTNSILHYHVATTKTENARSMQHADNGDKEMLHSPGGWVLDYLRMQDTDPSSFSRKLQEEPSSNKMGVSHYTSKSLMCCISQYLPTPAALNPKTAAERLVIIDTGSTERGIYLARKYPLETSQKIEHNSNFLQSQIDFPRIWAKRPFQYSSAINPAIADIVVELLIGMVKKEKEQIGHSCDDTNKSIKLLDPTCGSGTFVALAVLKGIQAEGWDINPSCVDGTNRNVEDLLSGTGHVPVCKTWKVKLCDAAQTLERMANTKKANEKDEKEREDSQFEQQPHYYDCVVANLPWGQNTISYHEENYKILTGLSKCLISQHRSGVPCVFVTKPSQEVEEDLERLGFTVKGQACIPQRNFRLPRGTKKGKTKKNDDKGKEQKSSTNDGVADRKESTSDCVITVAISP